MLRVLFKCWSAKRRFRVGLPPVFPWEDVVAADSAPADVVVVEGREVVTFRTVQLRSMLPRLPHLPQSLPRVVMQPREDTLCWRLKITDVGKK